MTLQKIIKTYPKTDNCELQTLAEVRDWQLSELEKLIYSLLNEQKKLCSDELQRQQSGISVNHFENVEYPKF
jgi:hypothetical protein